MSMQRFANLLLKEHQSIVECAINDQHYEIKESLTSTPPPFEEMYVTNLQIVDTPESIQINIPKSFLNDQDIPDFFNKPNEFYAGEFYRGQKLYNLPSSMGEKTQIPLTIEQASKIAVDWIDEKYKDVVLLNEEKGVNPIYWYFQFGYINSDEVRAEILVHKKNNEVVPYMISLG
ncbi:hypothetical protein [Candidatus Lokiarchaeum ossiferum]|uniref:hypothetical protein n=1 Tax=Candidatus Lokiarchaeum ossiferum TaxID=2951803 RepID=UPI00352F9556